MITLEELLEYKLTQAQVTQYVAQGLINEQVADTYTRSLLNAAFLNQVCACVICVDKPAV